MLEIEKNPAKPKEDKVVRIAAYARVSSDKDAAFHSLKAQREYYNEYVTRHPNWVLAGLYSDNAISGTTTNRPEFRRMLQDCRDGKIDLVITKSITRFARNTVALLETIRELKAIGIDCYFEKENMHSISPDGELLITLLAMYAEEEARSASENQKWRIKKLFDEGKATGSNVYGYRFVNGKYVIHPGEAEVVRKIYALYLSGMGYVKIANALRRAGIPAKYGGIWRDSAIHGILTSEKYVGDMLLQKSFVEDFRTKKSRKNRGERRMVYVKNSHEAIIDRETYEEVQREMKKRHELCLKRGRTHLDDAGDDRLFTGLIFCGDCGKRYQRKYTNLKKYDQLIWVCDSYHKYSTSVCRSQAIPERILVETTKAVLKVDVLTNKIIREKIIKIRVPGHNRMIYELKDGSSVEVPWKHRSRRLSWTPEMRQAAREKALKQWRDRKEDK